MGNIITYNGSYVHAKYIYTGICYIRVTADSSIKGISPLFTYFVILIGFIQIYSKKKKTITITDALSLMVPYAIAFSVLWLLIVIGFYIIGLPLGINTGVML